MNKKILALLMALMMIITSAVAFADAVSTDKNEFTITKTYTSADATLVPGEELNFTATFDSFVGADGSTTKPDGAPTYAGKITAVLGNNTVTITGSTNTFPAAGKYYYTLKEIAGSVQGVDYNEETEIKLILTVGYDKDGNKVLLAVGVEKDEDGNKNATITNEYKVGAAEIEKVVSGNAANVNDTFKATVTVDAAGNNTLPEAFTVSFTDTVNSTAKDVLLGKDNNTFEVTLKKGTNVVINKLPEGAVVSVVENDDKVGTGENKYSSTVSDPVIAGAENHTITVTNTRNTDIIDTGVFTDNMPYIMLMAFVMMIAAAVVLKKRTVNE